MCVDVLLITDLVKLVGVGEWENMDGPLTDLEAIVVTNQFGSYGGERRIDRSDRASNRCSEGERWTELLIGAPKARDLPTWRTTWGPTSFAPMAASSHKFQSYTGFYKQRRSTRQQV